jgi:hypothetical protein
MPTDADNDLPPFGGLLEAVADALASKRAAGLETRVERLWVELPVEIGVRSDASGLRVLGSTPSQHVETGVLPVWHKIAFTLAPLAPDELMPGDPEDA